MALRGPLFCLSCLVAVSIGLKETAKQVDVNCPDVTKVETKKMQPGRGMELTKVSEHIGDIAEMNWTNVRDRYFSCTDGRNSKQVLSTPGGDAAEFLLALNAYEKISDQKLTQEEVKNIFISYLRVRPKFYMCTDNRAVSNLATTLGMHYPCTAVLPSVPCLDIHNPPQGVLPELMRKYSDVYKAVVRANNTGSDHLRLMMEHPGLYRQRAELTQSFIRSFFEVYWDKDHSLRDKLILDVLEGAHKEEALVILKTMQKCNEYKVAPLIAQEKTGQSVFLVHSDAVNIIREKLAEFFHDEKNVDFNKMVMKLHRSGQRQLLTTASRTAPDLPEYYVYLK